MPSGDDMDSAQDVAKTELAGEVLDSLGEPTEAAERIAESDSEQGKQDVNDPLYVQKRLKQQKRAHDREVRDLHSRIAALENRQSSQTGNTETENPYDDGRTPSGNVDEQIHKAVSFALGARDREERQAKEAEAKAHIAKQYQELNKHLDNLGDKYDDFDEVVRGHEVPFTTHMRDAALFLDMDHQNPGSAGEVLYKLAKNPEELRRISQLHPLEQAREMVKLSKALISGAGEKAREARPLGQIKNTPVSNSHVINEKTPIASLRQRMKSGNWK
jgi:hypothetical protein